jgi:CubicO group peptidase (beta-lactamase class C family)
VNTFILAWLVEEITGMTFQDALTKEVWSKIGAEANGAYIAPMKGVPITHGGFLGRIRDLARFGLLYTPSYAVVSKHQVVTAKHMDLLLYGGRSGLLASFEGRMPGVKHNVYQWDAVYTGYFKDDQHSEVPLLPEMRRVLQGVYGTN